jgi:hypothetical protein
VEKQEFKDRLAGKFFSIQVIDETYTTDTSEPDPNDSWDRASTSTDHSIVGFQAAPEKDNKYYDLVVPFEPLFEKDYFLLYAVYSTGDSFGRDDGQGIEFIGFYREEQVGIAQENQRKIETHLRSQNDSYSIKLKSPEGKPFDQTTPWVGYFESLDLVEIVRIERQR